MGWTVAEPRRGFLASIVDLIHMPGLACARRQGEHAAALALGAAAGSSAPPDQANGFGVASCAECGHAAIAVVVPGLPPGQAAFVVVARADVRAVAEHLLKADPGLAVVRRLDSEIKGTA